MVNHLITIFKDNEIQDVPASEYKEGLAVRCMNMCINFNSKKHTVAKNILNFIFLMT